MIECPSLKGEVETEARSRAAEPQSLGLTLMGDSMADEHRAIQHNKCNKHKHTRAIGTTKMPFSHITTALKLRLGTASNS